jgi:hypothetical protein
MITDGPLHNYQYWHQRAEEARSRSEEMHDPQAKATMLNIAVMCDRMADRVAHREGADK